MRKDDDFRREIDAHIALETDRLIVDGMAPADARDAALRKFGNATLVQERFYESRRIMWFDHLRQDLRYALRSFGRSPVFTLTAAVSLAIGIGATTTIFSVANVLLLQAPAGVADSDRLVDLVRTESLGGGVRPSSYPDYLDVRDRVTSLDGVYGYQLDLESVSVRAPAGGAERIFANFVTANYFDVLGVAAASGRLFDTAEADSPIVVLSHAFWRRRFNSDPAAVGQSLVLNGQLFTIVGVAHQSFRGSSVVAPDVWVPAPLIAILNTTDGPRRLTNRESAWLMLGGRLKDGLTRTQAGAELDAISRALQREFPSERRGTELSVAASSPIPVGLRPLLGGFLALLMGIVSLVLVIACANLGGVLLARATMRRREIAVRLAVGAGRRRLIVQLLTETALLFLVGGVMGVMLARGMTVLIVALLPAFPVPVNLAIPLDVRAVAFAAGLSLVAALLAGLMPALQASKADVVTALKDDVQGPSDRLRLRNAFVIGQVAFSILLVVCAGLLLRALQRTSVIEQGVDPRGIEVNSLDLSLAGYNAATGSRFASELLERIRALPGVGAASVADRPPLRGRMILGRLEAPGVTPVDRDAYDTDWNTIQSGYFETAGIPLLAGRDFSDADDPNTMLVVIVSESLAKRYWPGQDAIGRQLIWHPGLADRRGTQPTAGRVIFQANPPPSRTLSVVGVARDMRSSSGRMTPSVYIPFSQHYTPRISVLTRTTPGQRVARDLHVLVASIDPNLPILTTRTLEEEQTGPVHVQLRLAASVSGSVGVVGLLLAAIGIYGVTAYTVARRTREIGIRIAMGADRTHVIGMVLRQGLRLVLLGSVIGLALAAGASRLLVRLLFGVPPLDPVTFSGAIALFAAIGLAACYVPVRRATKIDPVTALRYE